MPNSNHPQVIVIRKRNKSHGHAHHGGAWKVAYADFMTALMAFFLLLWILSVSDEEKLKGLADYFALNDVPFSAIGGVDVMRQNAQTEGDSPAATAAALAGVDVNAPAQIEANSPPVCIAASGGVENPWGKLAAEKSADAGRLHVLPQIDGIGSLLQQSTAQGSALHDMIDNITLREEDGWLVIDIADDSKTAMFKSGGAELSTSMKSVLAALVPKLINSQRKLTVIGHTDAKAYRNSSVYGNWELSTDRAQAVRRHLVSMGIPDSRFSLVAGMGSNSLIEKRDPMSVKNRRISISIEAPELAKAGH